MPTKRARFLLMLELTLQTVAQSLLTVIITFQINKTFHSVRMISKQVRIRGVPCREVDQGTGDTAQKTAQWTVRFFSYFNINYDEQYCIKILALTETADPMSFEFTSNIDSHLEALRSRTAALRTTRNTLRDQLSDCTLLVY